MGGLVRRQKCFFWLTGRATCHTPHRVLLHGHAPLLTFTLGISAHVQDFISSARVYMNVVSCQTYKHSSGRLWPLHRFHITLHPYI